MSELKRIEVVAAIIEHEGKIFATQRGYGEWKDWWEFPGGKMEPGESREEALVREIREELATEIKVGKLLTTVEYDYPKFHLTMHCFLCTLYKINPNPNSNPNLLRPQDARTEGSNPTDNVLVDGIQLLEHEDARWLSRDELDSVKWLPADEGIIELLIRRDILWQSRN